MRMSDTGAGKVGFSMSGPGRNYRSTRMTLVFFPAHQTRHLPKFSSREKPCSTGWISWVLQNRKFKYNSRDGKYKLMEINLRSMMWNRVGYLSNVNLHYTQYLDAIGGDVPSYRQEKTRDIHLVCLKHEISNLIRRKGYAGIFYHNLFGGDVTNIALFDIRDLKPFGVNCVDILDEIIEAGRKRIGI